jgi:hypothetical protein
MSALPYAPSDSEDEFVEETTTTSTEDSQSPNQQLGHKVSFFKLPSISRVNETTTLPQTPTLVLATDLASSAFLQHILQHSNSTQVLLIQTLLQEDKPAKAANNTNNNKQQQTANNKPKKDYFIDYSLYLIPNSNTLIGVTNLEIPVKYANHLAKTIIQNEFFTSIGFVYTFNAVSIPTLSPQLQLEYSSAENYPIFFTVNNQTRLVDSTPLPPPPLDNKTNQPIPTLPPTLPMVGFNAALFTYATLYNVLCQTFLSLQNGHFMTELWTSFEKCSKLYQLQAINKVPSIYGNIERLTLGIKNEAMKSIIKLHQNALAYSDIVLPHTKQGGKAPNRMFI